MCIIKGLRRLSKPHPLAAWPWPLPALGSMPGCLTRWLHLSPQVYPLIDFPLREISLASQRGIAQHSAALASRARVLQQVSGAGAWDFGEARLGGPAWGSEGIVPLSHKGGNEMFLLLGAPC